MSRDEEGVFPRTFGSLSHRTVTGRCPRRRSSFHRARVPLVHVVDRPTLDEDGEPSGAEYVRYTVCDVEVLQADTRHATHRDGCDGVGEPVLTNTRAERSRNGPVSDTSRRRSASATLRQS